MQRATAQTLAFTGSYGVNVSGISKFNAKWAVRGSRCGNAGLLRRERVESKGSRQKWASRARFARVSTAKTVGDLRNTTGYAKYASLDLNGTLGPVGLDVSGPGSEGPITLTGTFGPGVGTRASVSFGESGTWVPIIVPCGN